MKEKELILPDDWEVKEVVGNKIVIKEKEKALPKTYEDCFNVVGRNVGFTVFMPRDSDIAMRALGKLLLCRNAWWKQLGWKPEWGDKKPFKWCIHNENGFIIVTSHSKFSRILAFPTYDIASQFLTIFRGLIEEAKELL